MTIEEQIAFKQSLKQFCQQHIEQRIAAANKAMNDAQESANNEEKSSAGDKYETGRAMGHLQKDMHARQLAAYIKELSALLTVNAGISYEAVCTGAYIATTHTSFFIAAGLGKQVVSNKEIFFLSPQAPLASMMQNKKQGDSFIFNGKTVVINAVF